jgi:hypothetical protein
LRFTLVTVAAAAAAVAAGLLAAAQPWLASEINLKFRRRGLEGCKNEGHSTSSSIIWVSTTPYHWQVTSTVMKSCCEVRHWCRLRPALQEPLRTRTQRRANVKVLLFYFSGDVVTTIRPRRTHRTNLN